MDLLPPERAALGESGLTTGGLAEDGGASGADDDGLGVREDGGDCEAARALDVHEEGSRSRHKGLSDEKSRWLEMGFFSDFPPYIKSQLSVPSTCACAPQTEG